MDDLIKIVREALGPRPVMFKDWPNEPIGGSNPYYRCSSCGRSDPEISYAGHYDDCSWVKDQKDKRAAHDALDRLVEQLNPVV